MGCASSTSKNNEIALKTNPMFKYPTVEELKSYRVSAVPTYVPDIRHGFVSKVYDGDSITVYCYDNNIKEKKLHKYPVRLNGIDCPELRTKDHMERLYAQRVQKFLSDLILHTFINIKVIKVEKYGRLLADIYVEKSKVIPKHLKPYNFDSNCSISNLLLKLKYAVEYNGGTKAKFDKNNFAPL